MISEEGENTMAKTKVIREEAERPQLVQMLDLA